MQGFKEYRVTLLSFSDAEPFSSRRERYFERSYPSHRSGFKFPVGGTVKWVNMNDEPVVVPDYPAHALVLNYFNYTIEE